MPDPPDLLDNDLYQFAMSQYAWRHHRDRSVRYRFRNRTFAVPLAAALDLDELRARLDAVSATGATERDVAVLRRLGGFGDDWLDWLRRVERLPAVEVGEQGGHLELTYEGPWPVAVFLETPVLATVSQLYHEGLGGGTTEGDRRLDAKVRHLRSNPQLRFMEFGTRRRYSRRWQAHVVERLASEVPDGLLGTSNVALAERFGLRPMGTMAHQLFMVEAALALAAGDDDLAAPTIAVLSRWEQLYPASRTLLLDTFTTRRVLPALGRRFGRWPNVRIDSGSPMAVAEDVLAWWHGLGEDPRSHSLVFSDALDLRMMSVLHDRFGSTTDVTFGWGTNLTNDVGHQPLSLVIKPDSVDGIPCVKLSDDIAKATGEPAAVQRYLELAGTSSGTGQDLD